MMNRKRKFNLNELASILEDDKSVQKACVYIEPPEVGEGTDAQSGDEDGEGTGSNLISRLLETPATATVYRNGLRQKLVYSTDTFDEMIQSSSNDSGDEASNRDTVLYASQDIIIKTEPTQDSLTSETASDNPTIKRTLSYELDTGEKKKQKTQAYRRWRYVDLSNCQKDRFTWNTPSINFNVHVPKSPVEIFEVFFDKTLLESIAEYSKQYARSKGDTSFSTDPEELQMFIAILIVSGYNKVPRSWMYWSTEGDVFNEAISKAIPRTRFEELMKYFSLCDISKIDPEDRFTKIRPLLLNLNKKFLAFFRIVETQNLNVDEAVVPYHDPESVEQIVGDTPIKLGYKILALTTPLGYTVQFEPCQGTHGRQDEHSGIREGGSAILNFISELQPGGCSSDMKVSIAELQSHISSSYHLTFDHLFSTLELIDTLTEKKIGCTCTIRTGDIGDCPLKDVKAMRETARGTYDYVTDIDSGLIAVRYNDNNVVNFVSNIVGIEPVQSCQKWSRDESQYKIIEQPNLICQYNQTIGGVENMDKNIEKYRISIGSKKWWWPIFTYCIDLCIHQSWHLYIATDEAKIMDFLEFRRSVAKAYICRTSRAFHGRSRTFIRPLDKRVPKEVRFDRRDHLIEPWGTQLRCASCGMKTKHRCSKCMVGVHDRCFIRYHTAEPEDFSTCSS